MCKIGSPILNVPYNADEDSEQSADRQRTHRPFVLVQPDPRSRGFNLLAVVKLERRLGCHNFNFHIIVLNEIFVTSHDMKNIYTPEGVPILLKEP